jgi:sulfhydrogenase subunit beta (sulfur reductase)
MSLKILEKEAVAPLVEALMADYRVVGPQAKGPKFGFDPITDSAKLRLDYDTTILPPKKVFQPQRERLATFTMGEDPEVETVIEVEPTVLLGMHTCDLHALNLLDKAFAEDYPDAHYLSRREQTVIVSLECLEPCDDESFCRSMGTLTVEEGFDLHLTDLGDAYAVEVGTEVGEELLASYGDARDATEAERSQKNDLRASKMKHFADRLNFDSGELPSLLGDAFDHSHWEELEERCFACGSCTNVCPTCYCFNVVDEVNLALTEGERIRHWDSCQLAEFARVAGGENFREDRGARQRHRFMRKGKYLYEKFDALGCVGCGRCIRTCPASISILKGFNTIHASLR